MIFRVRVRVRFVVRFVVTDCCQGLGGSGSREGNRAGTVNLCKHSPNPNPNHNLSPSVRLLSFKVRVLIIVEDILLSSRSGLGPGSVRSV